MPVNPPLIVKLPGADPTLPGTVMNDPNRWQPLALDFQITQNGIPLPSKVQTFVGSQWNDVTPFALTRANPGELYIDPGPPPHLGDAEFRDGPVQLLEFSQALDPTRPDSLDISPASLGNNPLGTNGGMGYSANPVTGDSYAPQIVKRADLARVLAEFWADGPESETLSAATTTTAPHETNRWHATPSGFITASFSRAAGGVEPAGRERAAWVRTTRRTSDQAASATRRERWAAAWRRPFGDGCASWCSPSTGRSTASTWSTSPARGTCPRFCAA